MGRREGVSGRQELEHLVFSEGIPDGGSPATTIQLAWNRLDAEWRYGEDLGRYLRWTDGQPHMDALSGEQLNVANVVVLYVPQWNTDIVEDPHGGALSIQFALWDSNQAILFRDGVQIEAFWQRWEREDMLILTDAEGEPVALKPGNTFYQVLPTEGHEVEIVIDPEN
jgi:hypothetical protein